METVVNSKAYHDYKRDTEATYMYIQAALREIFKQGNKKQIHSL